MLISLIIPVYNSAKYLEKCLSSCIGQTYTNLDIVVVNDGSTDQSLDIIKKFIAIDSRIRLINKVNAGLVEARKTGVANALADYIMFVDSDDYIVDNAVALLFNSQQRCKSDIVLANFMVELESGKNLFNSNNKYVYGIDEIGMVLNILSKNVAPTIWGKLMKKEVFFRTDTPSEITIGEDAVTILQIYALPLVISYIDDNIYHYIQHPSSMVNLKNKSIIQKRLLFLNWVVYYIEETLSLTDDLLISKSLDCFVVHEYFCLLKDGGNPSDFLSLYARVNALFKTNKEAFRPLGLLRTCLLWSFSKNLFLASVFRKIYTVSRYNIYFIKQIF